MRCPSSTHPTENRTVIDLAVDEDRSQLGGPIPDIPDGRLTVIGLGSALESMEGASRSRAASVREHGRRRAGRPFIGIFMFHLQGLLETGRLERGGESIRQLRYRRPLEVSQAASLPGTLCSQEEPEGDESMK